MRKISLEEFKQQVGKELESLPLIITKRGIDIAIVNFVSHKGLNIQPDGLKLNHPVEELNHPVEEELTSEPDGSTGQQFDKKLPTIELTPTKKVKQLPKFCPKHKTCQRQGNSYSCGCKI